MRYCSLAIFLKVFGAGQQLLATVTIIVGRIFACLDLFLEALDFLLIAYVVLPGHIVVEKQI